MKPITLVALTAAALLAGVVRGVADPTPVAAPPPNRADEPMARDFSLARATRFLDTASVNWTRERQCFTCHTNYAYLLARPAVADRSEAHAEVRRALEEMVEKRWPEKGPRWDAEVVMTAATLAFHDAATTGKLHPTTRTALDRIWSLQRDDGGFSWLKCNWPPMESDDHFGATMAAIAVGVAPEGYAKTPRARAGMIRLRAHLARNPPPTLHHTAMLLWANAYTPVILSEPQRADGVKRLLALQKEDGGWGLASLGDWSRGDGKPQDTRSSDGYGTGFVIYVLRRSGVPATHPQLRIGIQWLKTHQRESGRWFTASLNREGNHFISHAGTAFAVMALTECGGVSSADVAVRRR